MKEPVLRPDEALILKTDNIGHQAQGLNSFDGLRPGKTTRGLLALTNQDLIYSWESGAFKKKQEEIRFPLARIKIYNGIAQVKPSAPETKGGDYRVTVFFDSFQDTFLFPGDRRKEIKDWIEGINELLTGVRAGFDPSDIGAAKISRAVASAIGTAKPVAAELAGVAKPLIPIATAMASARHPKSAKLASAVMGAIESMGAENDSFENPNARHARTSAVIKSGESEAMPIKLQIESVKQLKQLVDAGVLSQEEFETKKKQILGL